MADRHPRQHGTRAAYVSGCRCEDCRAANANYIRLWRRGLRGSPSRKLGPFTLAHAGDNQPTPAA